MCAGGFTRRWSRSRPVLCIVYDVSSCAYYELWSRSRLVFQTNCIPHVHSDRILSCLIRGRMSKIQVASYLWSPLCTRVSQKNQKSEFWYATNCILQDLFRDTPNWPYFARPNIRLHMPNMAKYAKYAYLGVRNMVTWGVPEKILQNAVQTHWSKVNRTPQSKFMTKSHFWPTSPL